MKIGSNTPNEVALTLRLVPTTQPGENGTGWAKQQFAWPALKNLESLERIDKLVPEDVGEVVPMVRSSKIIKFTPTFPNAILDQMRLSIWATGSAVKA